MVSQRSCCRKKVFLSFLLPSKKKKIIKKKVQPVEEILVLALQTHLWRTNREKFPNPPQDDFPPNLLYEMYLKAVKHSQ